MLASKASQRPKVARQIGRDLIETLNQHWRPACYCAWLERHNCNEQTALTDDWPVDWVVSCRSFFHSLLPAGNNSPTTPKTRRHSRHFIDRRRRNETTTTPGSLVQKCQLSFVHISICNAAINTRNQLEPSGESQRIKKRVQFFWLFCFYRSDAGPDAFRVGWKCDKNQRENANNNKIFQLFHSHQHIDRQDER